MSVNQSNDVYNRNARLVENGIIKDELLFMNTHKLSHFTEAFSLATRWILYMLTFLLPLFFLPWGTSVLELNKQMLLVYFAVAGLVAWFGGMVAQRAVYWRKGFINFVPLAFVLSVLVSSCLSIAGYQSWVGQATQEYTSFLSIVLYAAVFYLVMNATEHKGVVDGVLHALIASGAVVGVSIVLGVLDIFRLPFAVAQSAGFNTVGTVNSAAQFLLVVLFVGFAYWLVSGKGKNDLPFVIKLSVLLTALSTVFLLFVLDFWVFWVMVILGVLVLGAFTILQSKLFPEVRRFLAPFILLVLGVVMLFLSAPSFVDVPFVVSPSYQTSWTVSKGALGEGVPQLFFGSGPGTYLHDFQLYKPVEVNTSAFWQTDFDRAKSWFLTMVGTFGIVGTAVWSVFVCWLALKSVIRLLVRKDTETWGRVYSVFAGWSMSSLGLVLYSSNMTTQFVFWLLSGLLCATLYQKVQKKTFGHAPRLGLFASIGFGVLAVLLFCAVFVGVQRYTAELAFAHAVALDASDADIEEVIEELDRATQFNKWGDVYYRNLSSAYFAQAQQIVARAEGELSEAQTQALLEAVGNSINAINTAVILESSYLPNWVMRGTIYREVMNFAPGAEDHAAESFLNATVLEPTDPLHYVDLARVYLIVADRNLAFVNAEDVELAQTAQENQQALLAAAEAALVNAVTVKNDYLVAHYYLAAVYERQGRLHESTERLLALRNNDLNNIGLGFQLGVMLMRLEEYDLAREELERIITLSPNYANAIWYLSALSNVQGDVEGAIALAEQVLALDPGNTLVAARIEQLKAGLVVEEIPEPVVDEDGNIIEVPEGQVIAE
jgi:hypothetical protein